MAFKRDSLATLQDRVYKNYMSRFKPLEKTPRYNLLKVLASAEAGMYHQLLGDLEFLSEQIFPDTATGDYLRLHWSDQVPPLYAVTAVGNVIVTGEPGTPVPAGIVFSSPSGKRYFTESAYTIQEDRTVTVRVKAEKSGEDSNLQGGTKLSIVSSLRRGIDSTAQIDAKGIIGGHDGETDEQYLTRIKETLKETGLYGKPGDFAIWAKRANSQVYKAWEFKNFSVFGALLIQCVGKNSAGTIVPVGNLEEITSFINKAAPPIMITVRTPKLLSFSPKVLLRQDEISQQSQEEIIERIKFFLDKRAAPGWIMKAVDLEDVIIDGRTISRASVLLNGIDRNDISYTVEEFPKLEEVTWGTLD
ncbi:baseplate J/gp47 family protein [Breznakiella homolactica]|uniref:Baseplate J/gp47 family protein n=1 Tax=Breznakiella homolactica TaxID=2798577 RepID=A0A7T7XPY9_9SPIR|nr:baseplate J/gp47 family protein [Breznakiella homolactica]QQO10314.1 baseplate J/gp47 family protein [Breznakiella homolactica]